MTFEVEIISREDIKPSSPTPSHLRDYKFTVLDHLIPSAYAPIILFYTSENNDLSEVPERLELLKKSLSETLTVFYPLGGKTKGDVSIECNDEGANFVHAKVNCPLEKFLVKPELPLLHKFLPIDLGSFSEPYVTNIQVNIFECGGIVIGLCISHKIVDASSLSTFLKGWSERANGCNNNKLTQPSFISPSLFSTDTQWFKDLSMRMWGSVLKQGKWVTKRFLFRNSDIAPLKAQTLSKVEKSTRVDIVSALLWKSFMAVTKTRFGTQRPSLASTLVNLRRKLDEGLSPEHAMGNILWLVAAENLSDQEMGLEELVGKLRNALTKVDSEFVEGLRGDKGRSIMEEMIGEITENMSKGVEYCGFTSWCNFGFYEADFGWGNPTWVTNVGSLGEVFMNFVMFVDTRLRDGIEAWVTLQDEDMILLEANTELLAYATLDPSPLSMSSGV